MLDCFKTTFPNNNTDCRFNKFHLTTHYCAFIREFGSLHAIDSGHGERQQKMMKKLYKNTTRRKKTAIGELGGRLSLLDACHRLQEAFGIETEAKSRREGKRQTARSKVKAGKQKATPIGEPFTVTSGQTAGDGWENRLQRKLQFLRDGKHERASFYLYLELLKLVRDEIGGRRRPAATEEEFISRYSADFWSR
jgi:hypothetical protein